MNHYTIMTPQPPTPQPPMTAADERATIVALLRLRAQQAIVVRPGSEELAAMADAIEHGEHLPYRLGGADEPELHHIERGAR